jgi:hypothetical protein
MPETPRSYNWLWPWLAILCTVGMWTYAGRVLIPYQKADAAAHNRPRGNLSDLYPRWLGARELLVHGRDPYSSEVTREIQIGFYGRPLDRSRPSEPPDEEGFAYPVYVVFLLAPTIGLPFEIIQKVFYVVLLIFICASTLLWLQALRRAAPLWMQISVLALTLASPAVMQGLKLRQMSLLVAGFLAIAVTLLAVDRYVAAGILFALACIKPQLMVLPLAWLTLWTLADWSRRFRLAVSFLASMAILLAASEWYLPGWIPRFWHAIHEYRRYTAAKSVMTNLIGAPWSWAFELLALLAIVGVCWRERRQEANTASFAFTFSLVLAATVLVVPTSANYNQALVIPALLALALEGRTIWRRSSVDRVLLSITTGLIFWPWISSIVLAALSFILPQETAEKGWAIPFWTAIQIPVGVAGLVLLDYYQRTFTASARPRSS